MAIRGVARLITEHPDWLCLKGQGNGRSEIVMETVAGRQKKMAYVGHINGEGGPIRRSNVGTDGLAWTHAKSGYNAGRKYRYTHKPELKPPALRLQGPANDDWVTVWFLGLKW